MITMGNPEEPPVARPPVDLRHELQRLFGHEDFRPGQQAVVEALLAGQSALALFPTGAGKSLCYQLPAVLMPGTALVVSPLIALMKDQVDALCRRGIAAARLDSSLSANDVQKVFADLRAGNLKLLYVAPERLSGEAFIDRLRKVQISMLAIDEAHCISEWGHNFRPEYLRLSKIARELNLHPVLTLTATATPEVARDICSAFSIAPANHVQTSFRRHNLHLRVTPCTAAARLDLLTKRLRDPMVRPAVVYVTFQKSAEQVAAHLARAGMAARAYHAGMTAEDRVATQEAFMRGECEIIVATIAFGMGIDKADIRGVIHFNLPKTLENYQQEIGRAGRDGMPAWCELLACGDDAIPLENFTLGDTPTPEAVAMLVRRMLGAGEEFDVSRYDLSQESDIRPLVVDTVITYLELDGHLQPTRAFYDGYQIQLLRPEEDILAGHTVERREFLAGIFASGKRGPKFITLAIEATAQQLGQPRERIVKALTWLEESGALAMKPSGLRHGFRLCGRAGSHDPTAIADRLSGLFLQREDRESRRLASIVDFAASPACITRRLLAHFGESMEEGKCGHCQNCDHPPASTPASLPTSANHQLTPEDHAMIRKLAADGQAALATPRQLTRFLCGLTSPATTRAKLTRRPEFGCFAAIPFKSVMAA